MLDKLKKLVESMRKTIKRSEVLDNFNSANTALSVNTVPMVDYAAEVFKDVDVKLKDIPLINMVNDKAGIKARSIGQFFEMLSVVLKKMNNNFNDTLTYAGKNLPELIAKETVTAKQAGIINIGENYGFMAVYVPDFIELLIARIDEKENGVKVPFSKGQVNDIIAASYSFGNLIKFYNETKDVIKLIDEVPPVRMYSEKGSGATGMLDGMSKSVQFYGFNGNPWYHVRMWWADVQFDRYESLKDKQNLVKLKLIDLKTRQSEEPDLAIQKQIEYYEEKVEKLDVKIRRIVED